MTAPLMVAAKLLENNKPGWLDDIYTMNLPKSAQNDTTHTIVLLKNRGEDVTTYGNNTFFTLEAAISVQIFFSTDFSLDLSTAMQEIWTVFINDVWKIDDIKPVYTDPDTKQLIGLIYFKNSQILKQERG